IVFYADGGPLDPSGLSPAPEPTEAPEPTAAPAESAEPPETDGPTESAAPTEAAETPDGTEKPAAKPGRTMSPVLVVLILAALLAAAGVGIHFVIKANLDSAYDRI
ncbi:MAG: hypothetical protein II724_07240, partial [Clostridia bacterium]|nr:hypothetical protein [Clostridia bacterium]